MTFRKRKSNKTRSSVRRGQNFESLELRQMMTSDLGVSVSDADIIETQFVSESVPDSFTVSESATLSANQIQGDSSATVRAMRAMAKSGGEIALRKIDQQLLDQLFVYIFRHSTAISASEHLLDFESMLLVICLEQQREIELLKEIVGQLKVTKGKHG